MLTKLTTEQSHLAEFMSDLSERCLNAGWMTGLEYVLWDALINGEKVYGHDVISTQDISNLKHLSDQCNSWIYFDDETEETAIEIERWKVVFDRDTRANPKIIK